MSENELIRIDSNILDGSWLKDMKEDEMIRAILEKIYEIRMKHVLFIDRYLDEVKELVKEESEARNSLKKAQTTKDIGKWREVIKGVAKEKDILREKRYMLKEFTTVEDRLRAQLIKLEFGE